MASAASTSSTARPCPPRLSATTRLFRSGSGSSACGRQAGALEICSRHAFSLTCQGLPCQVVVDHAPLADPQHPEHLSSRCEDKDPLTRTTLPTPGVLLGNRLGKVVSFW